MLAEIQRARDGKRPYVVERVADAICRIAAGTTGEQKALAILVDYFDKEDKNSQGRRQVVAMGRSGPGAAVALPRLRERNGSGSPQLRDEALQAVAAIEGAGR